MRALPSGIAISLLVTAHFSEAQLQERVYPFIELTDEMRARIDLRDGLVDDWSDVLGEPILTPLDFALVEGVRGESPPGPEPPRALPVPGGSGEV